MFVQPVLPVVPLPVNLIPVPVRVIIAVMLLVAQPVALQPVPAMSRKPARVLIILVRVILSNQALRSVQPARSVIPPPVPVKEPVRVINVPVPVIPAVSVTVVPKTLQLPAMSGMAVLGPLPPALIIAALAPLIVHQ